MPYVRIGTIDDPRVTDFRNIPDAELLAGRGLFVAEGRLVVRRLLASARFETCAVLITSAAVVAIEDVLPARPDLPVYVVSRDVMNGIAGFNVHRGCLAIGRRPPRQAWTTLAADARRLVVLEGVGNPDNVGSVFRNAAAFGVDAVLLGPACADPLYRKAIRTSMGAALALPFAEAAPLPDVLSRLRTQGWTIVALTPAPAAPPLREVLPDPTGPLALVLGHEGEGLSPEVRDACTHHARIPMHTGVDSVNVATAAAIALYEVDRAATGTRTG